VTLSDREHPPDTIVRLTEIPNIIDLKEASGDISQIAEIITQVPPELKVFFGRRFDDAAGDSAGRSRRHLGRIKRSALADDCAHSYVRSFSL
jgi:hypothetical protein